MQHGRRRCYIQPLAFRLGGGDSQQPPSTDGPRPLLQPISQCSIAFLCSAQVVAPWSALLRGSLKANPPQQKRLPCVHNHGHNKTSVDDREFEGAELALLRSGNDGHRVLIAGAGLAAALLAQRLSRTTGLQIIILEASGTPFGEHTWSFHLADVSETDLQRLEPLIAHRWSGQSVRFRDYQRHLSSGYASLTSESVRSAMERLPNVTIRPHAPVALILDRMGLCWKMGTGLKPIA